MRLADSTTDSLFIVNCFGYFLWMFFKKCKILNIGDANLQQKWASQQKNSAFCLRKLTRFVTKWHLWSIFVQNFNLFVSETTLHWLAQELERNSLLTRIFEPISLWQQKSFVLTRDVGSAHIVLVVPTPRNENVVFFKGFPHGTQIFKLVHGCCLPNIYIFGAQSWVSQLSNDVSHVILAFLDMNLSKNEILLF